MNIHLYDGFFIKKNPFSCSCQPSVMGLLKQLKLETYNQYIKGRKFMQLGGHKIGSYASVIPSLSFLALIDLQRFISKVNQNLFKLLST